MVQGIIYPLNWDMLTMFLVEYKLHSNTVVHLHFFNRALVRFRTIGPRSQLWADI